MVSGTAAPFPWDHHIRARSRWQKSMDSDCICLIPGGSEHVAAGQASEDQLMSADDCTPTPDVLLRVVALI